MYTQATSPAQAISVFLVFHTGFFSVCEGVAFLGAPVQALLATLTLYDNTHYIKGYTLNTYLSLFRGWSAMQKSMLGTIRGAWITLA